MENNKVNHFVSASCGGEHCGFTEYKMHIPSGRGYAPCGKPASHKVGEEIPWDDPFKMRHNLTMYVCCEHFGAILGSYARELCGLEPLPPATPSTGKD